MHHRDLLSIVMSMALVLMLAIFDVLFLLVPIVAYKVVKILLVYWRERGFTLAKLEEELIRRTL